MKRILEGLLLFAILEGCSQSSKLDKLFNYPINRVQLPEVTNSLSPEYALKDSLFYQFCYVCDSLLVGVSPAGYVQDDKFVTVTDLSSGVVVGQFCDKGRGPNEFLSPIAADLQDGLLSLYDYMTGRYSELDIKQSIIQGCSVFSRIVPISTENGENKALLSIHIWNDSILAFDAGQNSDSPFLVKTPDYVVIRQKDGETVRNYNLFEAGPLSGKRRGKQKIAVKEQFGQVDCFNCDEGKVCSVMAYIPQINIFDINNGKAIGIRIKDYEKQLLNKRIRQYQDVSSDENRVYALFLGVEENEIPLETKDTELHIFDWRGELLSRFTLPGVFLGCQATEKGLYLTKLTGNRLQLCIIQWNQLI